MVLMPVKAAVIGRADLEAQALLILVLCAIKPESPEPESTGCTACGGSLEHVRKNSKFCSKRCRNAHSKRVQRGKADAIPAKTHAYVGSMYSWDPDHMESHAVQEISYVLLNWLRTVRYGCEVPASPMLANEDGEAA